MTEEQIVQTEQVEPVVELNGKIMTESQLEKVTEELPSDMTLAEVRPGVFKTRIFG